MGHRLPAGLCESRHRPLRQVVQYNSTTFPRRGSMRVTSGFGDPLGWGRFTTEARREQGGWGRIGGGNERRVESLCFATNASGSAGGDLANASAPVAYAITNRWADIECSLDPGRRRHGGCIRSPQECRVPVSEQCHRVRRPWRWILGSSALADRIVVYRDLYASCGPKYEVVADEDDDRRRDVALLDRRMCGIFLDREPLGAVSRALAGACDMPVRLARSIRASGMIDVTPPFIGE